MTTCKNCANEFKGKFCPDCGQKAKTSRITIRQIANDIRSHFIHFDQGFLYTILELARRPGNTIREYIEGKRVRHVRPIKFVLWSTAISFLIMHYLGIQEKLVARLEREQGATDKSKHMGEKVSEFISSNPSIIMFLTIPVMAFCSWLLFRKRRLNYAEHFTLNAYLMGQLTLFSILNSLVLFVNPYISILTIAILGSFQWLINAAYYGWAYGQFFEGSKKIWSWIKAILVLIGGYVLLILLISVMISTVMYFFKPQIDAWISN